MTPSILRDRVRARMEALDISQIDAAERGGLRRDFIHDLVNGAKSDVRSSALQPLARALDCSAAYLIGEVDDPTPFTARAPSPQDRASAEVVADLLRAALRLLPTSEARS